MKRRIFIAGLLPGLAGFAIARQGQNIVSPNYLTAQEALAADNFTAAKAAVTALAKESQGVLKTQAEAAASASDIASLRKAFKPLSETIIRMELPSGYGVAFCPMFDSMKGASWVQKRGVIANPYYGKAMLTCGEFKK
jgi:hypothetical protein